MEEKKTPAQQLYERAALLRAAAVTITKRAKPSTYGEHGEHMKQAAACRREAGILIRRARQLDALMFRGRR